MTRQWEYTVHRHYPDGLDALVNTRASRPNARHDVLQRLQRGQTVTVDVRCTRCDWSTIGHHQWSTVDEAVRAHRRTHTTGGPT